MLQFETLLLRQLQKQQTRDEFCDTVLHTQGVSVPVHSCVLSAFSPRLYSTLSSMPAPASGQRRLIQVQSVDACTLLGLVSLLYSGQLRGNREQVFSAAQTLGIEFPQWQDVRSGKDGEDVGKDGEEEVDAGQRDDTMARRPGEVCRREKEKIRESGTQTECGTTELGYAMPQNLQTVYLIDQFPVSDSQELDIRLDLHDPALAMQAVYPERASSACDALPVAPEALSCQKVRESVALHGFLDQSLVVPGDGAGSVDNLKQYEGNIPGFINHFLNAADSLNTGRRSRGCSRAKEERAVKRARGTGRGTEKEWVCWMGGGRGGRRRRHAKRWGLAAGLARRGQGGGRVGRLLETRTTGKNPMKTFQQQQGKEGFEEAKEARGRGRPRGRNAGYRGQNESSRTRRPRGRSRVRPLPASRNFLTMDTVDPTDLGLLHSVAVAPAEPIDTLLDDFMAGLHFLPPSANQTNQQKAAHPNGQSVKPSEPKQHLEGELGDILDHFLRTFDQQVGCCALDVGDDPAQDNAGGVGPDPVTDTLKTCTQLPPHAVQTQQQNASSVRGTRLRLRSAGKKSDVPEYRRLTRSQSLKRKVETALTAPQNTAKRKCKEKQSANAKKKKKKKRQKDGCEAHAIKPGNKKKASGGPKQSRDRKVCKRDRNKKSVEKRGRVMDGVLGYEYKNTRRQTIRIKGRSEDVGEGQISSDFQAGGSSAKCQIQESCIELASSAMEKVRMLLQLQDEDEDDGAERRVETEEEKNGGVISPKGSLRAARSAGSHGHQGDVQTAEGLTVRRRKHENKGRTTKGRRQDERRSEKCKRTMFRRILASDGGKNTHQASLSTTKARSSDPGLHFLRSNIPHTQPCPALPSLHTTPENLQRVTEDEEDDVDVLEVSSGDSDLLAVSPVILGTDLSTEDEEAEDVEIDVLGLEQD